MSLDITLVDQQTGNTIQNGQVVQYSNGQVVTTSPVFGDVSLNIPNDPNTYYIFSAPGYNVVQESAIALLADGATATAIYLTAATGSGSGAALPIALGVLLLAVQKKKKTIGDAEPAKQNYMPVLLVVGAVLALGGLNKLLQALGIEKSAEATALSNNSSSATSPWNPNYYKQFTSGQLLDQATADADATTLYKAFGLFGLGYDLPGITAVIHSLSSQAELSQISESFSTQYGKDLFPIYIPGVGHPVGVVLAVMR